MVKWLESLFSGPETIQKESDFPKCDEASSQESVKQDVSRVLSAMIDQNRVVPVFIDHRGMRTPGDVIRFVEAHAEKVDTLMYLWENNGQMQLSLNMRTLMSVIDSTLVNVVNDRLAVRDEVRALLPSLTHDILNMSNLGEQIVNIAIANHQELSKHEEMPGCYTISFNEEDKAIIMTVP